MERYPLCILPIKVYRATKKAAAKASRFPYHALSVPPPARASTALPPKASRMAATPRGGIFPLRKRAKPRAVKMTSVDTSTVDTATPVHFRDSNQVRKWRARQMPLRVHSAASRARTRFSSARNLVSTAGSSSNTVQPRRYTAVTTEGAWE